MNQFHATPKKHVRSGLTCGPAFNEVLRGELRSRRRELLEGDANESPVGPTRNRSKKTCDHRELERKSLGSRLPGKLNALSSSSQRTPSC